MECENCNDKDFEIDETSNRFVCKSCGTFTSLTQNAFETEQFTDAVYGLKSGKKVVTIKGPTETDTPNPYRLSELFTWILRHQVDTLVSQNFIPDPDEFVPLIYDLWQRYLQVTNEITGPLNKPHAYPLGWGVLYEPGVSKYRIFRKKKDEFDDDQEMIYSDDDDDDDDEDSEEEITEKTQSPKKKDEIKKKEKESDPLVVEEDDEDYADTKFTGKGQLNNNEPTRVKKIAKTNSSDKLQNERKSEYTKPTDENIFNSDLKCLYWRGLESSDKKSDYIQLIECNLALIYLAIRFSKRSHPETLLVSDLLRLVSNGRLPYLNLGHDIPRNIFTINDGRISSYISRKKVPCLRVMIMKIKLLARLLELKTIPKNKFFTLTNMCLRWLNLPCDLAGISASFARKWYTFDDCDEPFFLLKKGAILTPDYHVMAHVLLVLRYLFLFNGIIDSKLSLLGQQINSMLNSEKKVFVVNSWLCQMKITCEMDVKYHEAKSWVDFQKVKSIGNFLGSSEYDENKPEIRLKYKDRMKFYKENAPGIIGAAVRNIFDKNDDDPIDKYDIQSFKSHTVLPFVNGKQFRKECGQHNRKIKKLCNQISQLLSHSNLSRLPKNFDDCDESLKSLIELASICLRCENNLALHDAMLKIETGYIYGHSKVSLRHMNECFSAK